jgi:hypothetical protein
MDVPVYPATSEEGAQALLNFIRNAPMGYGTWRDLKGLYKRVEADPTADPRLLGAFAARFDAAALNKVPDYEVGIALPGSRTVVDARVRGGYLYALTGTDYYSSKQFRVFDLAGSDFLKPTRVSDIKFADAQFLELCGDYAITVNKHYARSGNSTYLTVFDVSDPKNARQRGEVEVGGTGPVVVRYPYVFTAVIPDGNSRSDNRGKFYGLRVVSIEDPDNPRVVAEQEVARIKGLIPSDDGETLGVVVDKTGFSWRHLPGKEGVRIFDVSVATNPRQIATLDINEVEIGGCISGGRLYVPALNNYYKRLAIYDLSNPSKPRHLGTWKHRNTYNGVDFVVARGDVAFVALRNGGVETIDARDPTNPTSLGEGTVAFWGNKRLLLAEDKLYFPVGERIRVWNVAEPARPQLVGVPPSPDTIGYMKRRARRVLRNLSKTDPARFAECAFHALATPGDGAGVDARIQWVTMDLLYGGGDWWYQQSHGRGAYSRRSGVATGFGLRRREERGPSAWDARPDLAERLLTTPKLPFQTHEFAARVLRNSGRELPTVTDADTLRAWLVGDSLLLQAVASRSAANVLDSGKTLKPEVTALAYFRASRFRRVRIEAALETLGPKNETWRGNVAAELTTALARQGLKADETLTRRGLGVALLLARRFDGIFAPEALDRLIFPFLNANRPELDRLVVGTARDVKPKDVANWINRLAGLPEARREETLVSLEGAVRGADLSHLTVFALYDQIPSAREMAWRLLAASATPQVALATAWNSLLDQTVVSEGLRTAMSSPYALSLLERAGITNEQIAERLQSRPFLAELISRETFASLVRQASPETLLRLTAAMPDAKWDELRGGWLRLVQEGVGLVGVWKALQEAVDTDETGRLIVRLLENAEFSDALLGLGGEDAEVALDIRRDPFDGLLRRWVERRAEIFTRDSAPLLLAATHELSGVREWGLARAKAVGFGLPFALRLLECEIPASVAVGREFFGAVPTGGDREFDYALALCDSPLVSVRRFGREFVTARWETLPQSDLLRALFENPDPESQAFVSEKLPTQTGTPEDTGTFRSEVLRQKNRARKAKEAVKRSEAAGPTVDTATLLELARGSGTPRDAEWALSQLARRALAGEQIPGFALDGAAG